MTIRVWGCAVASFWTLLMTAGTLLAQTPAPVVIKVDTREVLVDVTVTEAKGAPVHNLTRQDFTLTDDGKPRVIDDVSLGHEYRAISALPGTLHPANGGSPAGNASAGGATNAIPPKPGHSTAIILDEANSFFADAAMARQNVHDLMDKLEPDERIALYVIVRKKGLILLQDYTTDRSLLKASMARHFPSGMRPEPTNHFNEDQPVPPYPMPPVTRDEAFVMWRENSDDARLALQKLAEQLAPVPGRKNVFWLTNAFPPEMMKEIGLQFGWDKTIAALNKADVAVNTVDTRGLYRASNQVTGTVGTMRQISEATGGNTYFNRNDLDAAIAEGIAASRAAYVLRFHLNDDERDNRFHTLKVKVDVPGLELYYRQGYNAGANGAVPDLMAGMMSGEALETRAASLETGTLSPVAQLAWFYTGSDRANVVLSVNVDPAEMTLSSGAGVHGQVEVVGIAALPSGGDAARFADTAKIDLDEPSRVEAFLRAPWHYQHEFTVAAGTYAFRLLIGAGPNAIGKVEIPLTVPRWNAASFGIGGVAFSTEARAAGLAQGMGALDPEAHAPLTVGGRQFVPAATDRFQKSGHLYFYTEVYEPGLRGASPPTVQMQVRVLDRLTGEAKLDTGMVGVGSYVHAGDPLIPFATSLPVAQLPSGSYRLEVRAGHSSGPEVVSRTAEFEVD